MRVMSRGGASEANLSALRAAMKLAATQLAVRPATIADCEQIYRWRNDPVTRAGSRNPEQVSFQEHERWFLRTMGNPERLLLVGEVDERPVGVIRFDRLGRYELEVSLYVDPLLHELRLGTALLRAGENAARIWAGPGTTFVATVLGHNHRSLRLFRSASYVFQGENGRKS